jgi:hypothetical protein
MQGRNLQTAPSEAKPSLSFSGQVWLLAHQRTNERTNERTNQPKCQCPAPTPSARSVHCFSTYESRNNFSNVLITDNGIKSSIFSTTVTCTDTVVITGLSPRYKNDAYNYQGCQPLDEKLPFFAEVIVKGGNSQISLLNSRYGSLNRSHAIDPRLTQSVNASVYLHLITPLKCHFVMPIHVL